MTALVLDLDKGREALILDLQKAGVTDIPVMEVRVAVDQSGSMEDEFRNGLVDRSIDRFLVAGLTFDDNETIDVGFFNGDFHEAPQATRADVGRYLRKNRVTAWGGTHYAPIIAAFETRYVPAPVVGGATPEPKRRGFLSSLFGAKKEQLNEQAYSAPGTSQHGGYAGIITDGDNGDRDEFERILARTSGDTFFQFIAIGNQVTVSYLTRIAAQYPHVHFLHIPEPMDISDEQFLEKLANDKLVAWINSWV